MALQKPRRWLGYRIELNDLVSEADTILDRFENSEIPLDDCFGSNSDPPEAPRSTILFFGPGTEPIRLTELIELLDGTSIHYIQAGTESYNRKVILIGGYNLDAAPVAPLSPGLVKEMRAAKSAVELAEIVQRASLVTPLTVRSDPDWS
jgi:hypothetical protein